MAARTTPPTEVLVVLPTYNERLNLEKVVAGVRRLGHDVLIVDDASPDLTGELADRLAAKDAGVRVLHRPSKLGLGSAYEDAFRIGLADGSALFVEMDADGSHLPGNLDAIISASRDSGGLALGSRYIAGGKVVAEGPLKKILQDGNSLTGQYLSGKKNRTATGYRPTCAECQQPYCDEQNAKGTDKPASTDKAETTTKSESKSESSSGESSSGTTPSTSSTDKG